MRIREYIAGNQSIDATVGGPRASASDFSPGPALVQLGDTITKVADHYDKLRRANLLDQVSINSANELKEYSFQLQNGSMDEQGNFTPAPDPTLRYGLFQQKVRDINDRVKQQLGGDETLYSTFQMDFSKAALAQSFDVRKNALDLQRKAALADIDTSEQDLADLAAGDTTGTMHAFVTGQLNGIYGRAVKAGVLDEHEAEQRRTKFNILLDTAQVRRDIRNDPENALHSLLGSGYRNLPPDQREKWATLASNEAQRRLKATEKAQEGTTDPVLYTDLRLRAGRGQNVLQQAQQAYENHQLKKDDFDRITVEVESHQPGNNASQRVPSVYKRGAQYITSTIAGEANANPFERQVAARTLDDWQDWINAHPNAGETEAQKVYRQYAHDGILAAGATIGLPEPHFMVGGRAAPDLAATWRKTKEAFEKKQIDRFEYHRQATLIKDWQSRISLQQRAAAQTPKESNTP